MYKDAQGTSSGEMDGALNFKDHCESALGSDVNLPPFSPLPSNQNTGPNVIDVMESTQFNPDKYLYLCSNPSGGNHFKILSFKMSDYRNVGHLLSEMKKRYNQGRSWWSLLCYGPNPIAIGYWTVS